MHKAIAAERELARQEKRPPRGPQIIQSPWRDRDPKDAPAGVKPVLRLRAPRDGETVIEDRVQGRVVVPNTQLDDMIILRSDGNADLQLRRGGGRPRHGHHPRHPRRRSSHQRRAASADLPGHGLGCPGVRPRAADPRTRRRQALQAPRRARHRGLSRHGLPARGLAQLSGPARLEPWRRRDLLHRADDRVVRHRRHQQGARAGSTSPSSPTSTATTSARPSDAELLAAPQGPSCPTLDGGAELAAAFDRVGWDKLAAALPSLKERAKTLMELVEGCGLSDRRTPACPRRQGRPSCSTQRPAAPSPSCCRSSKATADWTGPRRWRRRCATIVERDRPQARQGRPAPARRPHRPHRLAPRVRRHGRRWAATRRWPASATRRPRDETDHADMPDARCKARVSSGA